jgi:hypothetical protein
MGRLKIVKTTLEIPDSIFRRAKSVAAQRGIALRTFVTEAVEEKLAATSLAKEKPWVRLAGGLKHLHSETVRINEIMKGEFETVEPEDWE